MMDALKQILAEYDGLLGNKAHQEMMSYARPTPIEALKKIEGVRESAVCICLYQKNNEWYFPLIQRSDFGHHSKQIALPGGKLEPEEKPWEAAIRECEEELGLHSSFQNKIGKLSPVYIPPSNFIVYPKVSIYQELPQFKLETNEVLKVFEVSLNTFLSQEILNQKVFIPKYNTHMVVPSYDIEGNVLWGATSMILNEFKLLLNRF